MKKATWGSPQGHGGPPHLLGGLPICNAVGGIFLTGVGYEAEVGADAADAGLPPQSGQQKAEPRHGGQQLQRAICYGSGPDELQQGMDKCRDAGDGGRAVPVGRIRARETRPPPTI